MVCLFVLRVQLSAQVHIHRKEAFDHREEYGESIVPRVILEATHERAVLRTGLSVDDLRKFEATEDDKTGKSSFATVSDHSTKMSLN